MLRLLRATLCLCDSALKSISLILEHTAITTEILRHRVRAEKINWHLLLTSVLN